MAWELSAGQAWAAGGLGCQDSDQAAGRGSSTAPAATPRTGIPLEDSSSCFRHERPTRIPSRRLRSGAHPVQPKGTEGITVCGLDFSRPRLTAASSYASHPCYTGCHVKPQSRQLSTDAGPLARAPLRALKRPAWCYVTSTGRRVIKPVRRLHGLDSDEDWLPLHGGRYKPDSFLKDWGDSDGTHAEGPGPGSCHPASSGETPTLRRNPDQPTRARAAPSVFYPSLRTARPAGPAGREDSRSTTQRKGT